jgi:hypothetical protein
MVPTLPGCRARIRQAEVVEASLNSKAEWVDVPTGTGHVHCKTWPAESLRDWHVRHGPLA